MEQDKQVGHFVASILVKILPLLVFLCVGLYFGIRIGEGRYEFYIPNSPYYKKAIQQASSSGFSEGWDSGYDFKQKEEYKVCHYSSGRLSWNYRSLYFCDEPL